MKNSNIKQDPAGIHDNYEIFFRTFGDDAWGRLNELRLDTRAKLAIAFASKGSTVVECGTFNGNETAFLADALGASGKIYTFDACPATQVRREQAISELKARTSATIVGSPQALYDGEHRHVIAAFSPNRPGHTVIHHSPEIASKVFGSDGKLAQVSALSVDA